MTGFQKRSAPRVRFMRNIERFLLSERDLTTCGRMSCMKHQLTVVENLVRMKSHVRRQTVASEHRHQTSAKATESLEDLSVNKLSKHLEQPSQTIVLSDCQRADMSPDVSNDSLHGRTAPSESSSFHPNATEVANVSHRFAIAQMLEILRFGRTARVHFTDFRCYSGRHNDIRTPNPLTHQSCF